MESVSVISNNERLSAKKIRYINYGVSNYLIYTLDEKDSEGYVKLFVNKIVDGEEYIISEYEWNELKTVIPVIVKQIRANEITIFKDLNIREIKEINLDNARVFKLKKDIVDTIILEPEIEELNLIGKEITELFKEEEKPNEENLNKLEEFLKNPVMEEPEEEIASPIKPIVIGSIANNEELEHIKNELEQTKKYNDELKVQNEQLEQLLNEYKEKIEKLKNMIKDL